jgi:hypothetical protein
MDGASGGYTGFQKMFCPARRQPDGDHKGDHMSRAFWMTLTAIGLSACTTYGYPGSGALRTEIRDVQPFTVLGVHDNIEFTFTESKQRTRHDVKITVDDNLSRFVSTQVVNGRLDVRVLSTIAPRKLLLEVLGPPLQGFVVTTRAKGTADNLSNLSRVNFDMNTGGQLSVGKIETDNIGVQLATGAALTIQDGTTSALLLTSLSGASRITAENLRAGRIDAVLSGMSWAQVNAVTRINASLTEGSSLFYRGSPEINQQVLTGNSRLLPLTSTP